MNDNIKDYTQKVKDHWTTLEIFKRFDFHRNGEESGGKETRLLGNGGLLIRDNGAWFTFDGRIGGGPVEAWYYALHKKAMPQGEFWATLTEIGDAAGIERPAMSEEAKAAYEERHTIEAIFVLAAEYYHEQLPQEQRAWLHTRYGLTDETIDALMIGFAPTGGASLFAHLRKVHGISRDDLIKTGLFRQQSDGSIQDTFQGRIMFAYLNRGKVAYFIGRETDQTPEWEKERRMKYSKLLVHGDKHAYVSEQVRNDYFYGEDEIRNEDTIFITEGVTDCIIANQHGFPCVSPVTTSFRDDDHPKLIELTRRATTIYIVNDNEKNESGRNGALRTAGALWAAGKVARFIELPRPEGLEKIDLNDFLRQFGADEFRKLFPTAKTLLDIYIETAIKADAGQAKGNALRDVFRLIAQVNDGFLRAQWRNDLPKKLGIGKGDYDQFVAFMAAELATKGNKQAQVSKDEQLEALADGAFSIKVNNRQLSDIVNDALDAIKGYIENYPAYPPLYVRGGMLVRVVADEGDQHSIQVIKNGALSKILSDVAFWYTENENQNEQVTLTSAFPPNDVVTALIQLGEWPGIPALESIVNTPVLGRDGTLHTEPGYNEQTRLYYTGGVTIGDVVPTDANVNRSKSLFLNDLLVDFPFKDESSKAHAVAYALLPFVRQLIPGPTPLYLFNSPTPGTGKGKCINACAFPSLGYDVPTMTEAQNDDEWRKRLTTVLMGGRSHVVIDNVNNGLNSGDLASALTQPTWSDRMLGGNQEVNVRIKTVWAASGNNVPVSEELARRCILIQLDANVEKPWERTGFKHADLMSWARENRNELVTAAVTLVNAWIQAGKPLYQGKVKGSYEAWTNVMGGILQTAGIPGFLENESTMFEAAVSKTQVLADFVKEWFSKYQEAAVFAGDLFKLASHADDPDEQRMGDYKGLLDDLLGAGNQRSRQTKLGKILAENKDKVIAGHKIVYAGLSGGQKKHQLHRIGEPSPDVHHDDFTILPQENDGNTKSSGERGEPTPIQIATREEKNKKLSQEMSRIYFPSDVVENGVKNVHQVHHVHQPFLWKREITDQELWAKELAAALASERTDLRQAATTLEIWLGGSEIENDKVMSAAWAINPKMMYSLCANESSVGGAA